MYTSDALSRAPVETADNDKNSTAFQEEVECHIASGLPATKPQLKITVWPNPGTQLQEPDKLNQFGLAGEA